MSKNPKNPPQWAARFFRWYCNRDYLEDIEGDLFERFESNIAAQGVKAARRSYIIDVLKLFRPTIIRPLEGSYQLNNYGMFKNYLKVGFRSILKKKAFSAINITGLGVGIACCLLIVLYVKDELSFDRYHTNYDNIYRILHTYRYPDKQLPPPAPEDYQVWGSAPVGPALQSDFQEIEHYFRFTSSIELLFEYENKRFQENNIVFGDSTAFEVFSWKLISGDKKTALTKPNSIVLTESVAKKYFGDEDVLGKTFKVDQTETFEVTGVMEDVPGNSHFTFDGLISMTTFHTWRPNIFESWEYVDFYTYFILNEEADINHLKSQMPAFTNRHMPEWNGNNPITFEPLSDAYLHSVAARQPGITGSYSNIFIFSSIAAFILLIACINFMNLSTARSMERAKEIGVRKAIGAHRRSLIAQFLLESVLIAIFATILAMALIYLLLPFVENLSNKTLHLETLLTPRFILAIIGGTLGIGLLAGSYPAWILSRFKATQTLKGALKPSGKSIGLRKILVVFQFTLSIILIVGTAVVFTQLDYLSKQNLGFVKDQMLIIDFGWDGQVQQQIESVKGRFKDHPDVLSVSASRAVPGHFHPNAGTQIETPDGEKIVQTPGIYEIDTEFISNYEMEMAAGRSFSPDFPSDSTEALIINEAALELYGYSNAENIIGKPFFQWGREGKVIGVVKDFNYKSLHNKVEPLSIRFAPITSLRNISLKIQSDDIHKTISELETIWQDIAPHRPFLYDFLDVTFERKYESDLRFGKMFTAFAIIAVFIACLGLFGLTSYTTEQRTKEIGIRKVLGASVPSIVKMLSKDYVKLFVIAIIIAFPIAWYVMNLWLNNFAYKTVIGPEIFISAALIVMLIALGTVSWQSIKSALSNPVKCLKDE